MRPYPTLSRCRRIGGALGVAIRIARQRPTEEASAPSAIALPLGEGREARSCAHSVSRAFGRHLSFYRMRFAMGKRGGDPPIALPP